MSVLILTQEQYYQSSEKKAVPYTASVSHGRNLSKYLIGGIVLCLVLYAVGLYVAFGAEMDIARGRREIAALREEVALLEHHALQKEQAIGAAHAEVIERMEQVSSLRFIDHDNVAQSVSIQNP